MDVGEYWPSVAEAWKKAGSPRTPRGLFKLRADLLEHLAAAATLDPGPDAAELVWEPTDGGRLLDSEAALIWALRPWIAIAHIRALLGDGRYAAAVEKRSDFRPWSPGVSDNLPGCWLAYVEAERLGLEEFERGPSRLVPSKDLLQANQLTLSRTRAAGTSGLDTAAAVTTIWYWLSALAFTVGDGVDPYGIAWAIVGENDREEVCAQSLVEWCGFLELPDLARKLTPVADLSFLDNPPSSWELGMGLAQAQAGGELDVEAPVRLRVLEQMRTAFPLESGAAFSGTTSLVAQERREKFGMVLVDMSPASVPETANQFLKLLLSTRIELGQVEEALADLPPNLETAWDWFNEQNLTAQLAYLAGQIRGAAEERRRGAGLHEPRKARRDSRRTKPSEARAAARWQRTHAVVTTILPATVEVGKTVREVDQKLTVQQNLLLDTVLKLEAAADRISDGAFQVARDGLLDQLTLREQRDLDATANEALGQATVKALEPESAKDLRAYYLLKDRWKPEFARSAGLALGVAFERELRRALGRHGVPIGELEQPLERLLSRAYGLSDSPRLSTIAERARKQPGLDQLRNKAAHPKRDPFTEDDLTAFEKRLFADGLDGHGLLSNVVMFGRGDAATGDPG